MGKTQHPQKSEEVDLAYIEACCNTYNNLGDQRFCWILHYLGQNINQMHNSFNLAFYLILGCFIILFLQNRKLIKLLETKLKKED